jgi:hypothetical protein
MVVTICDFQFKVSHFMLPTFFVYFHPAAAITGSVSSVSQGPVFAFSRDFSPQKKPTISGL